MGTFRVAVGCIRLWANYHPLSVETPARYHLPSVLILRGKNDAGVHARPRAETATQARMGYYPGATIAYPIAKHPHLPTSHPITPHLPREDTPLMRPHLPDERNELSRSAVRAWDALARRGALANWYCFSPSRLAPELGISRSTMFAALRELTARGYLERGRAGRLSRVRCRMPAETARGAL